ncbi:MAG TPA: hypothetical protein VIX82_04515 [Solirubrobacteraceae bacterium]
MVHIPRRLGRGRAWVAVISTLAILSTSSVALSATRATVVFLASNKGKNVTRAECARHGCGPQVTAPILLDSGRHYKVVVTGTVSVWEFWPAPCGQPEARPEFATSPRPTPTSDDAQFRFAFHIAGRRDCRPLPSKTPLFQINLGGQWFHPIAVGNPSSPSGDHGDVQHPYTFLVIGAGSKPKFRFMDYHPTDNSGKFRIAISAEP